MGRGREAAARSGGLGPEGRPQRCTYLQAFALYLESVAVLCQLFMFMKDGKAQPHTAHFLAAQAFSRLMSFLFWASSFSELSNPDHVIKQFVGNWVVAIQLLQLIVMADFIYHYVRCIQKGIPVSELLTSTNV